MGLKTLESVEWVIPLTTALTLSLLAFARSIGILIHTNASELGLPVLYSKEIELQQITENELGDEREFSAALYRLLEADKTQQAWDEYQAYIKINGGAAEARLWQTSSQWPNPALSLLAGQRYIERLFDEGDYRRAWEVLRLCFERNGNEFTLIKATTTLDITLLSESSKERFISSELLKYFPKDFPNHPKSSTALLRAIELMINNDDQLVFSNSVAVKQQKAQAKRLFDQTRIQYPQVKESELYQKLQMLLR